MSNITSSILLSQFQRIEKIIQKRIECAQYMNKKIADIDLSEPGIRNVYQLYTIRFCRNRDKIQKILTKNGIGNKIYFKPIHLTPYYKSLGYREGSLPVTEGLSKEVLSMPIYPDLTRKEMDFIAKTIWKIANT